jgi:hypothetical protein
MLSRSLCASHSDSASLVARFIRAADSCPSRISTDSGGAAFVWITDSPEWRVFMVEGISKGILDDRLMRFTSALPTDR